MTLSNKYRILKSDLFVKYDENTYWTAYFIDWISDKEEGVVFLKWDDSGIIGKSCFVYDSQENGWIEKILKNYNNIDCIDLLPYTDFINKSFEEFMKAKYLTKWFDFKLYINSKILNDETYTPTVTTTQNRIPNSGIVVEKEVWEKVINYDLKINKKKEWKQLSLF